MIGWLRLGFARTGTWQQAGKCVSALVSEMPKRNGWTIAQHAGDRSPDRTQRLLNRASWDALAAMSEARWFAVAGLEEAARRGRRRGGDRGDRRDRPGEGRHGDRRGKAPVHGVRGPRGERDQHGAPVLRAGDLGSAVNRLPGPRSGENAQVNGVSGAQNRANA